MKKILSLGALLIILLALTTVVSPPIGGKTTGANAQSSVGDWFRNLLGRSTTTPDIQKEEARPYSPDNSYEDSIIRTVESAEPSVVSIIVTKDLPVIERCTVDPFFGIPDEFRDFFGGPFSYSEPCTRGTRKQEVGGGTGFIVTDNGYILTNKHVVLDEKAEYTVLMNNEKKYPAKVVGRDAFQDIAILKIDASRLKPLVLGDSDGVRLGQSVVVIGNALGEFRNTVSVGVVSGLSRNITAGGAGFTETIEGLIQTDAAINPGNSGGPVLNLRGEVIGVSTAIAGGDAQNIGFAIPINNAKRAVESVKRTGTIQTPYIGVHYVPITKELAEREELPVAAGALIRGSQNGPAVLRNSPAAKADLRAEDIIIAVNGTKLDATHSLSTLLQKYIVGETVVLTILRDGKEMKVSVTLEERK